MKISNFIGSYTDLHFFFKYVKDTLRTIQTRILLVLTQIYFFKDPKDTIRTIQTCVSRRETKNITAKEKKD